MSTFTFYTVSDKFQLQPYFFAFHQFYFNIFVDFSKFPEQTIKKYINTFLLTL